MGSCPDVDDTLDAFRWDKICSHHTSGPRLVKGCTCVLTFLRVQNDYVSHCAHLVRVRFHYGLRPVCEVLVGLVVRFIPFPGTAWVNY